MRYIIRRNSPEDLAPIRKEVSGLDQQLEKPTDGLRRTVGITLNNLERINYLLVTTKKGADWVWSCPSIELVADSEKGLFNLLKRFSLPAPAHLAHLENQPST